VWLQPRGQFHISEIEAPRRVISYITKEIYKPDSQDQLFIYQAPLLNPRIERASPFRIRSRKWAFGLANG